MLKNIILRIIYVALSLFIAKVSYNYIYEGYLSYLPKTEVLDKVINNISSEISTFRKQYIEAYEKSLFDSVVVFLLSMISLEYINATLIFKNIFTSMKDDLKSIRSNTTNID